MLLKNQFSAFLPAPIGVAGAINWKRMFLLKKHLLPGPKKNVILLELDFPRRKQLPAELAQQNQSLQQAFKVRGYPTIWLFYISEDPNNHNLNLNALGSLGYPSGSEVGKEEVKFLNDANLVLANGKK